VLGARQAAEGGSPVPRLRLAGVQPSELSDRSGFSGRHITRTGRRVILLSPESFVGPWAFLSSLLTHTAIGADAMDFYRPKARLRVLSPEISFTTFTPAEVADASTRFPSHDSRDRSHGPLLRRAHGMQCRCADGTVRRKWKSERRRRGQNR
jgi:hypothetical protein